MKYLNNTQYSYVSQFKFTSQPMSKFKPQSSFFKRNATQQINITTKISQKQLKKNKKIEKNCTTDVNLNVSDNDFDKLMEENDNVKTTDTNTGTSTDKMQLKFSSYLEKITHPHTLTQLVSQADGNANPELYNRIKYDGYSGSQLLNSILNKYQDPNKWNWINDEEYGKVLSEILEDNFEEQLLCLLLIQNYSVKTGMQKITYKDKDIYFIKLIFQLLFTQDIIHETVYWKWHELLSTFTDVSEDIKNKLFIQTTEFFNILKMTFVDEDENGDENGDELKNENKDGNKDELEVELDVELEVEENKDKIPEEQDWNMDDI